MSQAIRVPAGVVAILVSTGILAGVASPAYAFGVDGVVNGFSEGYTEQYSVGFLIQGKKAGDPDTSVGGGQLFIGRDGPAGDIFIGLKLPAAPSPNGFIDNVYGQAATNPLSNWNPKGRIYDKVLKSDAWEFKLNIGGTDKFLKVDYIGGTSDSSQIAEIGVDKKTNQLQNAGGALVAVASSLQYNLAKGVLAGDTAAGGCDSTSNSGAGCQYGDTTNSPDPISGTPAADWQNAVQYELQLDGSQFTSGTTIGLADISMAVVHASPNFQGGDNKVGSPCMDSQNCLLVSVNNGDPTQVPEPGTLGLFGFGLAGLAFLRRRRRSAAAALR